MRKKTLFRIALLSLAIVMICSNSAFAADKTLLFEEKDGKLVMDSIRSDEGNWFMDMLNMIPGVTYHDKLNIDNKSSTSFKLYMRVVPVEQEEKLDELLELIHMDVQLDGKEIYSGKATGKAYEDAPGLTEIVLLGEYGPRAKSVITTDIKLDESVGLEYNDLLTKIDWEFMVTEIPETPKTGDTAQPALYGGIAAAALLAMIFVFIRSRKLKEEK